MTRQTEELAEEVFNKALSQTILTEDEREELTHLHHEALMYEQVELMKTFGVVPEDYVEESDWHVEIASWLGWACTLIAGASAVLVYEHGVVWLGGFVLSGLCLLVAKWVDKG